jgi:hypothetical protein
VRLFRSPVFRWDAEPVFYFDDIAGRRLRPELVDSKQTLEEAKAFARAARDDR